MARHNEAFVKKVVLASYDLGVDEAATTFNVDIDDLHDWRSAFIDTEYEKIYPPTPPDPNVVTPPHVGWLTRLLHDPYGALGVKIALAVALIVVCYVMPHILESFVDPLTNTVVWLGFTALYLLVGAGLSIDLLLFIQHRVNFDFLNPLQSGGFDYATLLRSENLSAYEKCRINQQKYLAYLFAYCAVIWALASLTSGGGV